MIPAWEGTLSRQSLVGVMKAKSKVLRWLRNLTPEIEGDHSDDDKKKGLGLFCKDCLLSIFENFILSIDPHNPQLESTRIQFYLLIVL